MRFGGQTSGVRNYITVCDSWISHDSLSMRNCFLCWNHKAITSSKPGNHPLAFKDTVRLPFTFRGVYHIAQGNKILLNLCYKVTYNAAKGSKIEDRKWVHVNQGSKILGKKHWTHRAKMWDSILKHCLARNSGGNCANEFQNYYLRSLANRDLVAIVHSDHMPRLSKWTNPLQSHTGHCRTGNKIFQTSSHRKP